MYKRSILTAAVWGCCVAILLGSTSMAGDWPQWRGPQRDGHVIGVVPPEVWPKELKPLWKVEVGTGHSSPVVVGEQVFVFSRQGDDEVVRAMSVPDGQLLWLQRYPAPYEMSPAAKGHGKGPKSTPLVAQGRLVTLGISGILSCWDAESGKRLWQHEFSDKFQKTSPLFGTAMSPVAEEGLVLAHVGGHNSGALTAFDAQTGQVKWQWDGEGPAYTSPILGTLGGTRQVVTQSQDACIGVAPADGSLLWSFPFKTQHTMNVVTPVVLDDLVVFSGYKRGTSAYRLGQSSGKWSAEQLWHNPDVSMFMSSPVLVKGRLYGFAQENKGPFFCLDVSTGKTLWTSDGRMGENAALVVAGNVIAALTTGSELIAFRAGTEQFDVLARYKVADTPTWAHPAVVEEGVLIKDESTLALWTGGR